jgi:glutaredoxin
VLVASLLAFSAGRSLLPTEIFASEGERVKFLATIGEPESTRIIALVTDWCPACRSLESDLGDRHIKYARLDIENNPHGRELFKRVSAATGSNTIPKVILDRNVVARGQLLFLDQE